MVKISLDLFTDQQPSVYHSVEINQYLIQEVSGAGPIFLSMEKLS